MIDIILGKSNDTFGFKLAHELNVEYGDFRTEYYPDGENSPRLIADYDNIDGRHVVVVYRRVQRPDRNDVARYQMNLLDLIAGLTDADVVHPASVEVLLPYYLKGRQDHNPRTDPDENVRRTDKGKAVGYKNLARMLSGVGAKKIVTFDPHFCRGGEGPHTIAWTQYGERGEMDVEVLSAIGALAEYARERISENALIIAPDGSADWMVREFARYVNKEVAVFGDKARQNGEEVTYLGADRLNLKGRDVVIVDDILSTLGTVVGSLKKMDNPGTIDVYAVHAVLPEKGFDAAKNLTRPGGPFREIVATDAISSDFEKVSVIGRLVKHYKERDEKPLSSTGLQIP